MSESRINFNLLQQLVAIHGPSGEEFRVKEFLLSYVEKSASSWKVKPEIVHGDEFQDAIILIFGEPRTAIFAHMDTVGFTVRYENELVPIGGPAAENGYTLIGSDNLGPIECKLQVSEEGDLTHDFPRGICRGTSLVFASNFRSAGKFIQSCSLDNRLGVFVALKVAETLQNGAIVFSTYEEHGGGSVSFLSRYLYERFQLRQALISDVTWVTSGVKHGEGVAISIRDRHIPRRKFMDRVAELAQNSGVPYQLEVEFSGSSDGRELQSSPFPIDWCFIGAPEDHVHSPNEKIHKADVTAMINMYGYLMEML